MNTNVELVQFTAMLAGIGVIYGKALAEQQVDLYWQVLKDFEWLDVKRGFEAHIKNADSGQFFPRPADIVKFIEGSGETKALTAWAKVAKAMQQIGAYQSVSFDDPLIHAVLEDLGGWVNLCACKIEELPFRANEFQKRYMMFVNIPPLRYPKYCCGITEAVNVMDGYAATRPVLLIGEPHKAQQVMQNGDGAALLIQAVELQQNENI